MKAFAAAYPDREVVLEFPAKVTWYHNCTLLDRVKDSDVRMWYTAATIENGWTRDVMVHQIESELYRRNGKSMTNCIFRSIVAPYSDQNGLHVTGVKSRGK